MLGPQKYIDNFILFDEKTPDEKPINKINRLIYKGLRNIETDSINRYYFSKYLKYKTKSIQLKNNK